MKIAILIGAALLGATGVAATPAEAQRHDRHHGGGWQGDRGWHGDRGWRGDRHWRGDRGWRGNRGYGWNRGARWHGGYARSRVVCRVERGYYGRERRCFSVYR
ncbi:hypothetical protein [Sphingomonas sp.]|uniref:hypothetical protein n=1 Tax=Sphingomonas sp. TaxID=28214 RepID=UPI0035BBD474